MDLQAVVSRSLDGIDLPLAEPLSREEFRNKVLGLVFGNALGDALGLRTEFYSDEESKLIWGEDEFRLTDWPDQTRGFPEGDWTDDTDQLILILQSYLATGLIEPLDFSQRLLGWIHKGIPEFGDQCGMGIGALVFSVVSDTNYPLDPHSSSFSMWKKSRFCVAPNGAVMRTSVLGAINYSNLAEVLLQTIKIATVTHSDPRCVASCVALTASLALMLQGNSFEVSNDLAIRISKRFICEYTNELKEKMLKPLSREESGIELFEAVEENFASDKLEFYLTSEIDGLGVICGSDMGYTYICVGCGFWAGRQGDWAQAIRKIVLKGGDADTNAAVAGAYLGCKVGFDALPQHLVTGLKFYSWLLEKTELLIDKIYIE